MKRAFAGLHEQFPDVRVTIESMIAEADIVAVRLTFSGTDHRSRRAGCHLGSDLRGAQARVRRAARSGADMNGQHRPALAARLTQRWVRAYTAHLDPARRDTRRAELASDLWEHEADAKRRGLGSIRVNAQMVRRLVAGIPADLSWRRQPATPVLAGPASVLAATPSSR